MIKIVCDTLEEVYLEASQRLECPIDDLHIDIVQYPRNIFGIIKKKAIAIANKKETKDISPKDNNLLNAYALGQEAPNISCEAIEQKTQETPAKEETPTDCDAIKDVLANSNLTCTNDNILDSFYASDCPTACEDQIKETVLDKDQILIDIQATIEDVFCLDCVECQVVEVSFYNEKTIYIKLKGKDASLLIGKNGYRYKAISYLMFFYIFSTYKLFVKMEIDEFLANQTQMIKKHLREFVKQVETTGYGRTDVFDGVLLHLGVEHLREVFPHKMVVIKGDDQNNRFIKVSDFKR